MVHSHNEQVKGMLIADRMPVGCTWTRGMLLDTVYLQQTQGDGSTDTSTL